MSGARSAAVLFCHCSGEYEKRVLIETWLKSAERDVADDENLWAFEAIGPLASQYEPNELLEIIRDLVKVAPSARILSLIGAGPLETLLDERGEAVIDKVTSIAALDDGFLFALANVWPQEMRSGIATKVRGVCERLLAKRDVNELV